MNAIAETARQNAMQIEAKKDGLSQMQSGEWTLRLKLHASDVPTALLTAPMGTRYMLAMVEIGDNEEPVQQRDKVVKNHAQRAALLCKEGGFQVFLTERYGGEATEDGAIQCLYQICGVSSRSELYEDDESGARFRELAGEYQDWLKE